LPSSAEEAAEIKWQALGFPVALKVRVRPDPHKSDVGGVRLVALEKSKQDVIDAGDTSMSARIAEAVFPAARIDAVFSVQKMGPSRRARSKLFHGGDRRPDLRAGDPVLVMAGTAIEVIDDSAVALSASST